MDDDTILADLMVEVNDPKEYKRDVETSPKRGGQVVSEEDQSPSKAARTSPRKIPRLGETGATSSARASSSAGGGSEARPAGESSVRMVVQGEILVDGDLDMEFPEKPPELSPGELAEVEAEAANVEIMRLIEMGVLRRPKPEEDINQIPTLTTRMVCDWRFRQGTWMRRARLVARDFNWLDPNRSDTFAPTGTQSTMRLVPALCQLQQWTMRVADVKDAYVMCDQPKSVKVVLSQELAGQLGLEREWVLGKVLPGQREGAAVWFNDLKSKLQAAELLQCPESPTIWTNSARTLTLMVHVDDIVMGGIEEELERVESFLKQHYKLNVEKGDTLSFLKRSIETVDGTTRIKVNDKYIDGLVTLLGGVRKRRTPGDFIIDNVALETEDEVKLYRSCVGTLLYVSGDRPDVQYLIKELASKLQSPTRGAMTTLKNLIGYMYATRDFHLCMDGTNPSRSFRHRAAGLATGPEYVDGDNIWLLEVATDSDWNGQKETRSSTSCGMVFLGGIWIFGYSRTQKHITLSSTKAEYVALVSGASEGLFLKAIIQHLVLGPVELKVMGDNTSSISIAMREGVSRIKHLDGRLLWLQQRQQRGELQLRRVDTLTNPSDLGTKVLGGRRVRLLLRLLGFTNGDGDLGTAEFEQEVLKKENKEQLQAIRKIVHSEHSDAQQGQSSTLLNKVAKRLMRLTVGTLLFGNGEALGLPQQEQFESNAQCFISVETISMTTPWTIFFLVVTIVVLLGVIVTLLKIMHVMHLRIEATRDAMDWIRTQMRQTRDRRLIRAQEQARTGIYLEDTNSEEEDEFQEEQEGEPEVAYIRMVTNAVADEMIEENVESEPGEDDGEIDMPAGATTGAEDMATGASVVDDGYDFEFDVDSISMHGYADDQAEDYMEAEEHEQEQEEEEEEEDLETEYGSLDLADEDFSMFESLEGQEYDDYRFSML
eukprot:s939_g16.t1